MTGVMTAIIKTFIVCDNDHCYLKEEEKSTTTRETTAQREGNTPTPTTRMTWPEVLCGEPGVISGTAR